MRIISWNTNGLRATHTQGNLFPLFNTYDPDILCLQEVKATEIQLTKEIKEVSGYDFYLVAPKEKKGYSGVAVYTKEIPLRVNTDPLNDIEGRVITIEYEEWVLINCYFPNGGGGPDRLAYKLEFYQKFLSYCNTFKKPLVFCGDINTAHTEIDLARPKENVENTGFLPVERAWIDSVIAHQYHDAFRLLHPDTIAYTYWDQKTRARERNVGWRIDYFFVSKSLVPGIQQCIPITEYPGSDHCPVLLDITV